MKLGVIDLGTNALRFSVYEQQEDFSCLRVHREKHTLQLGDEVFSRQSLSDRFLSDRALKRTVMACSLVRMSSFRLKVRELVGVATSAVREAANGQEFLSAVTEKSGLPLSVISGNHEAHLIGRGAAWKQPPASHPQAILDIGGGSTELCIIRRGEVAAFVSLPFGGARLAKHLYADATGKDNREETLYLLVLELRAKLYPFLNSQRLGRFSEVLCSSGTIRALLSYIERAQLLGGAQCTIADVSSARKQIARVSPRKLRKILPLSQSWRWSHLLGTSVLLEEMMRALGADSVTGIKTSLADGIAVDYFTRTSRGRESASCQFSLPALRCA